MEKLYAASITPSNGNSRVSDSAMGRLWDGNFTEETDGFLIEGSSRECLPLSREERVHTSELVGGYADRTGMFAYAGAISTEEAIFYARKAKEMEIQNIAATSSFCFGFFDKEIAGYYYDIAEAVDMSVLYYNTPPSTHRELNPSQPDLAALLKSGVVGAIKHTNPNLYQMEQIHDANPDTRCYGGFENCMVAFLAFGRDGFTGSNFNFTSPQHKKVTELYLPHHDDEARILQPKSNCTLDAVLKNGLCVSLKYIALCQGTQVREVRKPMCPLAENQKAEIDRVIGMYMEIK